MANYDKKKSNFNNYTQNLKPKNNCLFKAFKKDHIPKGFMVKNNLSI